MIISRFVNKSKIAIVISEMAKLPDPDVFMYWFVSNLIMVSPDNMGYILRSVAFFTNIEK